MLNNSLNNNFSKLLILLIWIHLCKPCMPIAFSQQSSSKPYFLPCQSLYSRIEIYASKRIMLKIENLIKKPWKIVSYSKSPTLSFFSKNIFSKLCMEVFKWFFWIFDFKDAREIWKLILLNDFPPNLLLIQYMDIFENTVSGLKRKGPGTSWDKYAVKGGGTEACDFYQYFYGWQVYQNAFRSRTEKTYSLPSYTFQYKIYQKTKELGSILSVIPSCF